MASVKKQFPFTMKVYLILSFENEKWIRIGNVYRKKEVAKDWLSFVQGARRLRECKIKTETITVIGKGKADPSDEKRFNDLYEIDLV